MKEDIKLKIKEKELNQFITMFEFSLIHFKTEYILKLKELIDNELKKRGV